MKWIIGILIFLVICSCGLVVLIALVGGLLFFNQPKTSPTPQVVPSSPEILYHQELMVEEVNPKAAETEATLKRAVVPENDPLELAARLQGKNNIPRTLSSEPPVFNVGDRENFWVTNMDTNLSSEVTAYLAYITPNVYFWVDEAVELNSRDRSQMEDLVDAFDREIIPTNRQFFGNEWSPGIDNDERLYILYAKGLGSGIAGYFSSNDSFHPLAHEYSNAHEMFMLSADNTNLNDDFTYGVLAHEYQHMIHWFGDRNEETWLNEGFSELAAFLNGYYLGGFDYYYINNPDIQLTDWPTDQYKTTPHYGAAFLFVNYFLNRFGNTATQLLVSNDENGMDSVDLVLDQLGLVDEMNNEIITTNDVFADWVVASYLKDGKVADGRYTYQNYKGAPKANPTEEISECPVQNEGRTVSQFGVDYIKIECEGDYTLKITGNPEVQVIPMDSYSGDYGFWSNKGDESDMSLTRVFDFSDISGPLTFRYKTWYDLEKDYDYLYLLVSEDGEDWNFITTPSGTAEDPSGNSYGWGYNGESNGWINEEIDFSRFAGKKIHVRFEYVTDAAVNGEGFYLDDVEIPQINYKADFETDDGGWQAKGFVRMYNRLPQSFILSVINVGKDISVDRYQLTDGESIEIPLSIGGNIDNIVLAISGTTRYTRTPAKYSYSIK